MIVYAGIREKYRGGFNKLLAGITDDLRFIEIRRNQAGGAPQAFIDIERRILTRPALK